MGGTAVETQEDAVGGGCPRGTGVGTVEANGVCWVIFQFAELGVFVGGFDTTLAEAGGGDGAVGLDVAARAHGRVCWRRTK